MSVKFCKDCKHFMPESATPWFVAPAGCNGGEPEFDLVSGRKLWRRPDLERASNAIGVRCGPEGKWFEVKQS